MKKLVEAYDPVEIYLFGSYVWGHPDDESDLDLLIVVNELTGSRYKMMVRGHKALIDEFISKDIIVYTKQEFDSRAQDPISCAFKIKSKGKRIYAKA